MSSRFEDNPPGTLVGLLVDQAIRTTALAELLVEKGIASSDEINARVERERAERGTEIFDALMTWALGDPRGPESSADPRAPGG